MNSNKFKKTKYMKVIEKLLNLNSSVEKNWFKKTKFIDEELENAFLIKENNLDEIYKIKSDLLIIIGWFSIFIYTYVVFYRILFIVVCSTMIFISFLLSCWRYFNKIRNIKLIIDHVQVFLPVIYLNLKALYIIFYISNQTNDHDEEIIRTIIYNWVATTFLIFYKLDGRPWVYLLLNGINFSTIIIINAYSYNNHYYYMDGITSLVVSFGGYIFKKYSDIKIRLYYGEKRKNKKMSNFFLGFINGLNGCYLNIKNDDSISYGSRMKYEMESFNMSSNNEINDFYASVSKDVNKDCDPFIFLDSSSDSSLPQKFLNSLKYYDKFVLNKIVNPIEDITENNETLYNKIKKLQSMESQSCINFKNIGIYYIKSINELQYYEVYYRKVNLTKKTIIYDLVFFKATDLIVSLIKIKEETHNKKQILGKLVHEFKTPLNSILGLIDNIKESKEDQIIIKNDLKMIKNLSNYVIFLINDIIHYSNKNNYNELNIIMQETNIRKIVVFSFEILNSLLSCYNSKSKSIKTELEFQDDINSLTVVVDETRLKQILLNLLSNSVKFTKSGLILIKCHKHPEKEIILISVADTGPGIREENQKNIFDDFFMESETYSSNSHGTGIGLSICRNLANRMNMEISFKSRLGKGTEFVLEIPINKSTDNMNSSYNKTEKQISESEEEEKKSKEEFFEYSENRMNMSINNNLNNGFYPEKESYKLDYNENMSFNENNEKINKYQNQINIYDRNPFKMKSIELISDKNNLVNSTNICSNVNNVKNNYLSVNTTDTIMKIDNNDHVNVQILIVDDDKYICNSIKILVKRIFKEANSLINVITASDGVEIIQKVIEDQRNGNKIKCIITDENMEYLNGSDAIKIIRNLEKDYKIKNVKIITATSQEEIQLVNIIKDKGADLVMSKPLSKSTLIRAFQDLKLLNL